MEEQSPSSRVPQPNPETARDWSDKHQLLRADHDEERRSRSLSPAGFQAKNTGAPSERWRQLSLSPAPSGRGLSPGPMEPFELQERYYIQPSDSPASGFWQRNKPAILVAIAQFFAALMNMTARLLELEGEGMHPFQVLLIRQAFTAMACLSYMCWSGTPDWPFGKRELWPLLVLRGVCGFFGIYGMWFSMMYIPLADATVITFLGPGVAGILCYFVLRAPFTRAEQLATLVALMGVVLIAQPTTLFAHSDGDDDAAGGPPDSPGTALPGADDEATPQQRLIAIGAALMGVCGAAGAFTTLRALGRKVHPLISVNYFAMICTIVCTTALIVCPLFDIGQPAIRWVMPQSTKQWLLFLLLGLVGFIMQYLLTSGLAADKTNRANAMVYTHMLFAVGVDRWVFHHRMGLMSVAGCSLILGSAITVMVMKTSTAAPPPSDDIERQGNDYGEAEGSPMLVEPRASDDDVRLQPMR